MPLVFEVLDSYKAGRGRVAVFKRYGPSLKTLITEFKSQNVIFSNNIANVPRYSSQFLDSSGFAKNSIGFMCDEAADESVRKCQVEAYHPILDLIREYRNDVDILGIKLGVPVAGFNVSWQTQNIHIPFAYLS